MTIIKIGLVTEGPTDQVVIRELLSSHLSTIPNLEWKVEFVYLQPLILDSTSASSAEGGWELVYKWCLQNPPNERLSTYLGGGLFANEMDGLRCDLILIHMDADICNALGDKSNVVPIPNIDASPDVRGKFIKDVVLDWLWPNEAEVDNKHVVATAVESVESWLVAGLSEDDLEPEKDRDIQTRLAILDHLVVRNRPVPKGIKRPKKNASNYTKISKVASSNIGRVIERCPHFKLMSLDVCGAVSNVLTVVTPNSVG